MAVLDGTERIPRFTIILPTTGRDSVRRALLSIRLQSLLLSDQILIVGRVPDHVLADSELFRPESDAYLPCKPGGDWGNAERNLGIEYACGTHLVFVDDDDILLPGAITAIRSTATKYPDRPLMFRMIDPNGAILWGEPVLRQGNQGTPCFVPPNVPDKLGRWGNRYESDYDFMVDTVGKYLGGEGSIVWCTDVIYACREFGGK